VIANLRTYIQKRSPLWEEYSNLLDRLESNDTLRLELEEVRRLRFLHESVAGDLARIRSQTLEPETIQRLESLDRTARGVCPGDPKTESDADAGGVCVSAGRYLWRGGGGD